MSEWIKVEDQLPKRDTLVLTCIVEQNPNGIWRGIISAYFNPHKGWIAPFTGNHVNVICWKNCPELPDYMKNEDEI
jgi:hypothetical protein